MTKAIVAVAAGLVLLWASGGPGPRTAAVPAPPADPNRVAVLPFRVADTTPGLADLRDWLQDLLVARLTGEGSPRALSPRDVANGMGAALTLRGELTGTPTRLELAATLAGGGGAAVQAQVAGSADSLPHLADQLTVRLLAARSAAGPEEGAAFAATSLAALRAYLAGREAYRRGNMHDAEEYLTRALTLDSLFAPAALGVATLYSNFWHWRGGDQRWLADAIWRRRDRMSPGERALLFSYFGPHYPGPATEAEMLRAAERATQMAPTQVEAWFVYGSYLRWFGPDLGLADLRLRSTAAFRRAFALDSTHSQTLEHLIMLAADAGDTAAVRRYLRIYRAHNANIETQTWLELLAADAANDSAARRGLRTQFAGLGETNLFRINWWGQARGGVAVEDADLAIKALLGQYAHDAGNPSNHGLALSRQVLLLFNQGRPADATRVLDQFKGRSFVWREDVGPRELHLYAALYWDGDRSDALVAARQLAADADTADADTRETATCALAEWWAAAGDWDRARGALARLRPRADRGDYWGVPGTETCVAGVEAIVAVGTHEPSAAARVARLDSLLRTPWWNRDGSQVLVGNLIAARLHEARGDVGAALDAVRRLDGVYFLSTKLRDEGRLSALLGDTAAAIRAYRHYLDLRNDPEASLRPEVDHVRAELQRLQATARPR